MKRSYALILSSFLMFFCKVGNWHGNGTKNAVISTLFNQRMLLLVKGTYATDNPIGFEAYSGGTGQLYQDTSGEGFDPTLGLAGVPLAQNLPIFIDIGEIRMSTKYQEGTFDLSLIKNVKDTKKFWDEVAPNRQVFCTIPYTTNSNSCRLNDGEIKAIQFFNGEGVAYPSNDPTSATDWGAFGNGPVQFYYTGLYLRSLVTAWATEPGLTFSNLTLFDNYRVPGINIVPRLSYRPGADSTTKSVFPPLVFPTLYKAENGDQDMLVYPGFDPYILEVRINLKENLMIHSYVSSIGGVRTLVGISDWNSDHKGESDMGGGLLVRSRIIRPEIASSLTVFGGTASTTHYYSVYRVSEGDIDTKLPLMASPVQGASTKMKYIHPGEYRLRCVGDLARVDGYPETVVRETVFTVPENAPRSEVQVNLSCP
ncbi:LIC11270 family surface protein [Leptospira alstonii]|uniref:Uncharacterized protein n=2 Tax=Leptospira alstonii TaxID=28452 RepID=M6D985_9LEPT|nr:hypothetical protein [Leptospira alstonii]EMJ97813.1 hypothetical protein LEP1GSC194_0596 [Leptospira alstonii serovar Sichuan str. 79601]EQA80348.1 hypothetical protein LEP1GSC193_4406 [Leptospira alstonii serovar Pingchang str. 80-412]